jgi:UDP-N-acetylglucosamine/UDP-N-acetylgalactosamine diphosphorylase
MTTASNGGSIATDLAPRLARQRGRLAAAGQDHVLAGVEGLSPAELAAFLGQLEELDLDALARLHREVGADSHADPARIEPAPYIALDAPERASLRAVGEDLLRAGRVAAFTVAGGQGTRLGWRGPKGTFPATVVTGKPLFRTFAEQIAAVERRFGVTVPWYIMTSPLNDAETRGFFRDNNWFGREERDTFLFPQGTMPSLSLDGKLLLEDRGVLAVNPDGHGGALRGLRRSGALEDMAARGIEQLAYFQVDNPLVRILDPIFLGLHAAHPGSSGEMSSKAVMKRDAGEKVGVFARVDGRTAVVEYSDLPKSLAEARDPDGRLRFRGGSIAIHLIARSFLERITAEGAGLPFHRALKKVPHLDPATGRRIEPAEPNAIKFETFVFDALAFARASLVVETARTEEFAPIKNAAGEDSAASSHRLQSDRAGAWLAAAGVEVPRRPDGHVDADLEISPLTALEPRDLAGVTLPERIRRGDSIVL